VQNKPFDIYHSSVKREGKLKNGDNFNFAELNDEQLVALCVADGVSSCPKDWLASDTACSIFIEKFTNLIGALEQRIKKSALASHSAVLDSSVVSGMAATLVAVIVDFNSNKIYYVSIGDSRIFVSNNEEIVLITKDDTISIPVKMNYDILINDGLPVFTHPITKAVGQREMLEFEINSYPFNPGESVILATDGIHNHGMPPYNLLELLGAKNISDKLSLAVSECSRENNDDATILILRRNDFPDNSNSYYQNVILKNIDYKSEKLYAHLIIDCAEELINRSINEDEWDNLKKCLEYVYEHRLTFTKDILINWLNQILMKEQKFTHIQFLLKKLIQISSI
jgi:PPM family protein phosphatase